MGIKAITKYRTDDGVEFDALPDAEIHDAASTLANEIIRRTALHYQDTYKVIKALLREGYTITPKVEA